MEKLIKNCPFCDKEGTTSNDNYSLINERYYIECIDCQAIGPEAQSKEEAINLWNDRT